MRHFNMHPLRMVQDLYRNLRGSQQADADGMEGTAGAEERSQTENQAASSEQVPESEQIPTAREEQIVADPEGAIRYGKTRAA